jgi:hypothetical protein
MSAGTLRQPVDRVTIAAMLLGPIAYGVACLAIPYGVDQLPTSNEKMRHTLDTVAHHAFATRLGFFSIAIGMLLLLPAMSVLRAVVPHEAPGRVLVDIGARLVAVGAAAIAIGNVFAPASEPSAVRAGLPRDAMVTYMRYHLVNGWDWAILVFYPLVTIGGVLLGIGLWRSRSVSRAAALLIAIPLVLLLGPPLSPPTVVLPIALEAGFVLVVRAAPPALM